MPIWREVSIASHWPSKLDVHPQAVEPTIRRGDGQHGQPQISIGIGPADELAATTAARVGAMDAVGRPEPGAMPILPSKFKALRASRLPCSCGPFVTISPLLDDAARLLLTLLYQGRSAH